MKESFVSIDLPLLPEKYRIELNQIKQDTESFNDELVPIFQEKFDILYKLILKNHPNAIKKVGKSSNDHTIESEIKQLIEHYEKDEQKKHKYHISDIDDPDLLLQIIFDEFEICKRKKMYMDYDPMEDDEDLMKQIKKTSSLIKRLHNWGYPVSIINAWNDFYKQVTGVDFQLEK